MKKVIAEWLESKPQFKVERYSFFEEMTEDNNIIGFTPELHPDDRYILVQFGDEGALAVNATGWLVAKDQQEFQKGEYFLFESGRELLEWMLQNLKK